MKKQKKEISGIIFLKYLLSSLASFGVDVGAYALLLRLLQKTSLSSIVAASLGSRFLSSLFNYSVNRKLVFQEGKRSSFLQYALLVLVQIMLSAFLVYTIHHFLSDRNTVLIKIVVDGMLFFFSYYIQKKYIFKKGAAQEA